MEKDLVRDRESIKVMDIWNTVLLIGVVVVGGRKLRCMVEAC